MGEIAAVADSLPPWVLIVLAGAVTFRYLGQALSEGSESWARAFGPLGRRWRSRAERRVAQEAADLASMKRQISHLVKDVQRLTRLDRERNAREALLQDYLVYDSDWHWRARLAAVESDTHLPEHLSFAQWEAIPRDPS